MEFNQDLVIQTVKNTTIQLAGFMVGTVASKLASKALNKDGTNQMLGNLAPLGIAAGAVAAGGMLHADAPAEAKLFLGGVVMGATYQGLVNYGVPAKIDTAVGLSGLGTMDMPVFAESAESAEILFDKELNGVWEDGQDGDNADYGNAGYGDYTPQRALQGNRSYNPSYYKHLVA